MPQTHPAATQFAAIFDGRTDVLGRHDSKRLEQQTWTEHRGVTVADYAAHLTGNASMGVFPLQDDGTTKWLAFDIDTDDLGITRRIRDVLRGHGCQAWIERTKVKGFHVWVLWTEPVQAKLVRQFAATVLRDAGAPERTEVFPKQDIPAPFGNWINLPYFGGLENRRVMITDEGATIPLVEFLARVKFSRFPVEEEAAPAERKHTGPLIKISFWGDNQSTYDGVTPTCVDHALAHDTGEGERNDTLARLVGYLANFANLDEDEVWDKVTAWNDQLSEPLPERELRATVGSVTRRGNSWGCKRIREVSAFNDGCSWEQCQFYRTDDAPAPEPIIGPTAATPPSFGDERDLVTQIAQGWLKEFVDNSRRLTDAPSMFHLATGLSVLSALIGTKVSISGFGSDTIFPSLYTVIMCPSGFYRKSTAVSIGVRLLRQVDGGALLPEQFSPESLMVMLSERGDRLMRIDEFGAALKHWDKANYMQGVKGFVTTIFDNQYYKKELRGAKGAGVTIEIPNPAMTILATTTRDWLQDVLKVEDMRSGFTSRILWVWADHKEPRVRRRPLDTQASIDHLCKYATKISCMPSASADFSQVDTAFFDWLDAFEDGYEQTGVTADISGVVARAATFVQKIATILAISDGLPAGGYLTIRAEHLRAAIAFVEWCIAQQKHMVTDVLQFSDYDKARNRVIEILGAAGGRVNYSGMVRLLSREKKRVDEVLTTMVAAGLIRTVTPIEKKAGRPAKVVSLPERVGEDEQDVA